MQIQTSQVLADWQESGLLREMRGQDVQVHGFAPVEDYSMGKIVFLDSPKALAKLIPDPPTVVVTTAALADKLQAQLADREGGHFPCTMLVAANVKLAQALLRQKYEDRDLRNEEWTGIHPSAVIHETARLAEDVVVGPNAVVGADCLIASGCVIMAGSVIEHGAKLGPRTIIHPNVTVGYDCELGEEVIVHSGSVIGCEGYGFAQDEKRRSHRVPQLGRVVIEDRVRVGACNCIDRAAFRETRIGAGSKLDNHCHLAHNVKIGQDCLLTAGLIVAGSTTLGDRVIASGSTGFIDHLNICDDAVFVHKAGVTKDVTEPGIYAGTPHQPMADYTRNMGALKKLAEMRKQLLALEKQVADLAEEKG
jgi:UDP-3-O-[3-hydroxymyristoyl] glucosamine N-acyltransferase